MNHETQKFVKDLFIKHAGFIPDDLTEHYYETYNGDILAELCEALNIYVDSDEDE
jgi:hypothetical protein